MNGRIIISSQVIFSAHYHHGSLWSADRIQNLTFDKQLRKQSKGQLSKKLLIFHQVFAL